MDDRTNPSGAGLYDQDFYAWTQEQAALIRDGRLSEADLTNLVEEIETLGRQQLSELRSRLRILLAHLLEDMYQPTHSSRSWKTTILRQRIEIADLISENPSLKPKLGEAFVRSYRDACKLASSETGSSPADISEDAPFTYAETVSEGWQPEAAAPRDGKARRAGATASLDPIVRGGVGFVTQVFKAISPRWPATAERTRLSVTVGMLERMRSDRT